MLNLHLSDSRACGVLLKALRAAKGITVREAADAIGVSHSSLTQWENGHRFPAAKSLIVVFTFYGVTVTIGVPPDEVTS